MAMMDASKKLRLTLILAIGTLIFTNLSARAVPTTAQGALSLFMSKY